LWDLITHPWKVTRLLIPVRDFTSSADALVATLPGLTIEQAKVCLLDFLRNEIFFVSLDREMIEKRQRRVDYYKYDEFLYMAVRFVKPQVVIETGVFDGKSSAVILQALNDNDRGVLISVDLPATETIQGSTHRMRETTLPMGCEPGWLIPNYLKARHRLFFGESKDLIPKLFQEYPRIDIFFHDSLHTFECQFFEYTTAWTHLSGGGLLLSDDIFWSAAFTKFCRNNKRSFVSLEGFGALRKPL